MFLAQNRETIVREQWSRTCTTAVPSTSILQQQISIICEKATYQVSRDANEFHVSSRLSRDLSHCHLAEAETGFLPCKEEDKLRTSSMQSVQIKSWHMQALHNVFFVFHFLSFVSVSEHFQFQSLCTPVSPWRLCMKQDNWVNATYIERSLKSKS